jgi:DNA modification methylase
MKHTIYRGDSLKRIQEITENSIALTVTSPPYFNAKEYHSEDNNVGNNETYQDYLHKITTILEELYRVTLPGGIVVWNTSPVIDSGKRIGIPFDTHHLFEEIGFQFCEDVIWCVDENTLMLTTTGESLPIKSMNARKGFVLSKNKSKLNKEKLSVINTGENRVLKIKTNSELLCTEEHRFLTYNGITYEDKKAKDLTKDDYIVNMFPNIIGNDNIDNNEARLIGYISGDGYIYKEKSIYLYDNDLDTLTYYKNIITNGNNPSKFIRNTNGQFGLKEISKFNIRKQKLQNSYVASYANKTYIKQLLIKYPELTNLARETRVPKLIEQGNNTIIKNYLIGIIESDGNVNGGQVQITTTSKIFAYQLQLLLSRLKIRSTILYRKNKDCYIVGISMNAAYKQFKNEDFIKTTKHKFTNRGSKEQIPFNVELFLKELKNLGGNMVLRKYKCVRNILKYCYGKNYKNRVGKELLKSFNKLFYNKCSEPYQTYLDTVLNPDIYFEKIHSITKTTDLKVTYDVLNTSSGWFLCGTQICHNCKPLGAAKLRCGGWFQNKGRPMTWYPNINTEYIMIYKKPGEREIKEYEDIRKYYPEIPKDLTSCVWNISPETQKHYHDAPFPKEIPRRLILLYSYPGDTVLDPFAGTFTVSSVCRDLNRNSIGIELSSKYIEYGKQNMGFYQKDLFGNVEYEEK